LPLVLRAANSVCLGPYGTNVCAHCEELIDEGREWEVVEALAAQMTVRNGWHSLDPERWRRNEHENITRWLEVRTTCETKAQDENHDRGGTGDAWPPPNDLPPDEPFDPRDI
jgi:hypothetical protein